MDRRPRSKTLRKGRFSEPGQIYFVTTSTHDRMPHFVNWDSGKCVVSAMRFAQHAGLANTLAYVVMPDHVHWLLELHRGTLSEAVRRVKGVSSKKLNDYCGCQGRRIWQPGFNDHALRREEELIDIARYIVANPLRAGLVKRLGDYPLWDAVWL